MDIYKLNRQFVDFCFENPSKIKPNHYALYFFAIEHCNRLGWKKEFGLPTTMTMEAIGIRSYNTYIKTFNELVEFGFFELKERSRNQYSSNIIEVSNFNKALDKALDKALMKHGTKQVQSTEQSIDSITKQVYNTTNIQLYRDIDFLKDFNELRVSMKRSRLSNINSIRDYTAKAEFKELSKIYKREDFVKAIKALFKQQQLPNGNTVMFSDPKHLILHFSRYLDAFENTNDALYGEKKKEARL